MPDTSANLYENPIPVNKNTLIRAQIFLGDQSITPVKTGLYIIQDSPNLPYLSLVTDPDHLWSAETGIHENWDQSGDAWERPVNVSLIENNQIQFQVKCIQLKIQQEELFHLEKQTSKYSGKSLSIIICQQMNLRHSLKD